MRIKTKYRLAIYAVMILACIGGTSIGLFIIEEMYSELIILIFALLVFFIPIGLFLHSIGEELEETAKWLDDNHILHTISSEKKKFSETTIHKNDIIKIILTKEDGDRILKIVTQQQHFYIDFGIFNLLDGFIQNDFFTQETVDKHYDSKKKKVILFERRLS